NFFAEAGTLMVLTGAGVSTASGIPGYRDKDGNWKNAKPVQFADFVGSARWRQRYWARSFIGWQRFSRAEPNLAHAALAGLEAHGYVDTLVTQNVDGLHQRAGSQKTIDLHGRLDAVRCLDCDSVVSRDTWQERLSAANPEFDVDAAVVKPDGDAELGDAAHERFIVPACDRCGGTMKPDVVFFGESVPRQRVAEAASSVERSGGVLVVGSSLMVFSGLRFVRQAVEIGKPVAIVNDGRTRADDLATLKLEGDCGDVLDDLLEQLRPDQHQT
ncbi:MAG: NAD-dependent protein deacetylase, partial [Pseudomonadota bacterium]